jgi:hypothetical protein
LTNGAVSGVTVIDQGAGYLSPPTLTFQNDPREGQNNVPVGSGAAAVATLTGAGTVTAVVCVDHGAAVTGTSVPTLSFSGGGGSSAAATALMCWSITAYTVTGGGTGYGGTVMVSGTGGYPATAPAYANASIQANLVKGRAASITAALSGGAVTATGQVVNDGGIFAGLPTVYVQSFGVVTTAATLSATMGGQTDTSLIFNT